MLDSKTPYNTIKHHITPYNNQATTSNIHNTISSPMIPNMDVVIVTFFIINQQTFLT